MTTESADFTSLSRAHKVALIREALEARRTRDPAPVHPLSHGQRALWFLHERAPESPAYHVAFCARFRASPDVDALSRACNRLVERHPLLRTVFRLRDGEPVQVVKRKAPVDVREVSVEGADHASMRECVRDAYARPFDLERGPLMRVELFYARPDDGVLLVTVHHIVFDGWSLWVVMDELARLYRAAARGESATLPDLDATYFDWIERAERDLVGPEGERSWAFWQRELSEELPALTLPFDRGRPAVQRYRGATHRMPIPAQLGDRVRALARSRGATPFVFFLAVYQLLLHRYSGQDSLSVGCPSTARAAGFEHVVGYFVNPVVIRSELRDDPTFDAFLDIVRRTALRALEHQSYPFPLLVRRLCPRRESSHSPLFQASFVHQRAQRASGALELLAEGAGRYDFGGLPLEYYDLPQQEGQFDLELEISEMKAGFLAAFKYDTDLFDAATIEAMADRYSVLLENILDAPETPVRKLSMLRGNERAELLRQPSIDRRQDARARCLHERFEQQAAQRGEAIAAEFAGVSVTYRELDRRSNLLAHHLVSKGVGPEVRVGLFMERSIDMIVGILGILKAGGAYVPVDPVSPDARVAFVLEDSAVAAVVTHAAQSQRLASWPGPVVCLDASRGLIEAQSADPVPMRACPDHLAYVIYTSGSTGRPKGVQVTHANVDRLFDATHAWFGFDERDVWTLFHSIAFDFSVWELFGALLYGGRLVVVPHDVARSPADFLGLLGRSGVSVLNQTPSAFRQLIEAESRVDPAPALALRLVVFGGEALDPSSLRPWFERHGDECPRIVNMYGITETTVHVTYRPLVAADAEGTRSLIGRPIPDLGVHLLDSNLEPVPPGLIGEIYVSGAGLSRGYLARPELDRERFVERAFADGETVRLYRSGDLARRLPGGDLEYLGRCDEQVKIRGYRIELGEIGSVLGSAPGVASCAVRVRTDGLGEKKLVAYVVPEEGMRCAAPMLREHLRRLLPSYMVPAAFVSLAALPLTANGKLDQRELDAMGEIELEAAPSHAPPRDALERQLVAIWQRVLGVSHLGIGDGFFDVGGHSVLAVHLMAEIERALGVALPLSALLEHPTVAGLAVALRSFEVDRDRVPSPLVPMQLARNGEACPFFCIAGGGGSVLYLHALSRHVGADRPVYGLQAVGLHGECPPLTRVEDIAARYVELIRSVQPSGPYLLGGHCFGGLVAFEVAQQLLRAGESVPRVALIDVPAPSEEREERDDRTDRAVWLARLAAMMGEAMEVEVDVPLDALRALAPDGQLERVRDALEAAGILPPRCPLDHVRGLFAVFMANSRARYVPHEPRAVPVTLFRAGTPHPDFDYSAAEDEGGVAGASSLGWGRLAGGEVRVEVVPGTHLSMLAEPNVRELAERLRVMLVEAAPAGDAAPTAQEGRA